MLRTKSLLLLPLLLAAAPAFAAPKPSPIVTANALQSWMSPDIGLAWQHGYQGQGTTITFVDEFSGTDPFSGNWGNGTLTQLHGLWTTSEAHMVAPLATIAQHDFNLGTTVALAPTGLNIINLSYAMFARAGYSVNQIGWSNQEASIINYAKTGKAVISKAAGNDSVAMGTRTRSGVQDYLGDALIGAQSAIFVGALNTNGTTSKKASLASYSDTAGSNTTVQKQFLVVGVVGSTTNLYGTSFAAPIISGYAAILGSKFTTWTPTQIANRLLTTARKDTLVNYNAATYGMGEASLANAAAPNGVW